MPELPDVAAFKKEFDANALNKKIDELVATDAYLLKGVTIKDLKERLEGEKFTSSKRYGKYLLIKVSHGENLVVHFGMDGYFEFLNEDEKDPKYTRVVIHFAGGRKACLSNRRKIGEVRLVKDIEEVKKIHNLGKDALEISKEEFVSAFEGKKGAVKSAIMDQGKVAGIGNVYADEILFQAGIHPNTKMEKLAKKDKEEIYEKMIMVFKKAESVNAEPGKFPENYLISFRKKGARCPSGKEIEFIRVGGRGTYVCPK